MIGMRKDTRRRGREINRAIELMRDSAKPVLNRIKKQAISPAQGEAAMRIISGSLGGREIRAPAGDLTRPAMARTRESLFSMLEARGMTWPGAMILDLFAGTGSLGIEALSRGAASALFVDNSVTLRKILAQNIVSLDLHSKCRIAQENALRFLGKPAPNSFNLVFIDPPYHRNFVAPCLKLLLKNGWLASGAFVSAEFETTINIETPESLTLEAERLFGQTLVKIWKKT